MLNSGYESFIGFVYGSPVLHERQLVWDSISTILTNNDGSWLLIGDYNQIEKQNHKLGGNKRLNGVKRFVNWKNENGLLDIHTQGVKYTWTNNREGKDTIMEILDKALCNPRWMDKFPNSTVKNLPILLSDHSPIIFHSNLPTTKKKRPYKLESWCLRNPEIKEKINQIWNEEIHGSSPFQLQRKLGHFLYEAKNWCLSQKKEYKINWEDIQEEAAKALLSIDDIHQAVDSIKATKKVTENLDLNWNYGKQRSKSKWDAFGDSTTSFFYKSVKMRGAKNEIRVIKNQEGEWIDNPQEIKEVFFNYFKDLFSKSPSAPTIDHNDPIFENLPCVLADHLKILSKPFSEEEIRYAVFSSKPLKSPGPDGIPPSSSSSTGKR